MKPEPPDLEAWRQATTLPEPARARLTRRLAAWTTDRPGLAAQVRLDTEPAPGVVARVTRRLRQAPTASPWRWSVVALAAAVALAAVVAAWPSAPRVADVRMAFDGVGHVERSGAAPLVVWESGTAHLDVTPQRGLALSVRTPEAVIQVVGTVFDVHRQAHSTRVTVERGAVDVECVGNAHVLVPAGESVTCLPGTLDGWVARALELPDPAARLEAVDRALGLVGGSEAVQTELLALRVTTLTALGRGEEAFDTAQGVAARPGAPAAVLAFVARERFAREGCGAVPAVYAALAVEPSAPEGLLAASCVADSDPAEARRLLGAASPAATGPWAPVAARLRLHLDDR